MTELDLYKFITENELEIDWRGKELVVWIPFYYLKDFTDMVGYSYFSEGGIDVNLQSDYIALDIADLCEHFGISTENIEPRKDE